MYIHVRLLRDYKCLVQRDILPFTCKEAAVAPPLPESNVFGCSNGGDGRGDSSTLPTRGSPSDSEHAFEMTG